MNELSPTQAPPKPTAVNPMQMLNEVLNSELARGLKDHQESFEASMKDGLRRIYKKLEDIERKLNDG